MKAPKTLLTWAFKFDIKHQRFSHNFVEQIVDEFTCCFSLVLERLSETVIEGCQKIYSGNAVEKEVYFEINLLAS